MAYITPVYDRTAADVANKTAKAYFNVADWARIYNNAQEAKARVESLLSITIPFTTLTTPTITTIPTVTDFNNLLANIQKIRVASCLPEITGLVDIKHDWIEGPSADAPDYEDANDWEKVIDVIYNDMPKSADYFIRCGVSAVGQERFWQNRFR